MKTRDSSVGIMLMLTLLDLENVLRLLFVQRFHTFQNFADSVLNLHLFLWEELCQDLLNPAFVFVFSWLNTVLLPHTSTVLLLTWLAAMGELFFTHSSTILTTARRILGSADFSIREVRMTWIKFFLISMLMTDNRVFTRSRLSIISSLVTIRTNTWKYSKAGPRQTTEQMHLSVHLSIFFLLQNFWPSINWIYLSIFKWWQQSELHIFNTIRMELLQLSLLDYWNVNNL